MTKLNKFSPDVRERAVRMVQEHRRSYPSLWAAVESIAPKIGCVPETLNRWVKRSELEVSARSEMLDKEKQRIVVIPGVDDPKPVSRLLNTDFQYLATSEINPPLSSDLNGKLIRSQSAIVQIVTARKLRAKLLGSLFEISLSISSEKRLKYELLLRSVGLASEGFRCSFKTIDFYDEIESYRSTTMLGGPFFTTEKFRHDRGFMPVVQIDLRELSVLAGINMGDGLLQLWYDQGCDSEDINSDKIVVIPRSNVNLQYLTNWRRLDFDEAEVTTIDPLPTDLVGFYWRGDFRVVEKYISIGLQCQQDVILFLLGELAVDLPSHLIEQVRAFVQVCSPVESALDDVITFMGTFEPTTYSHAEVGLCCVAAIRGWGRGGGSQIFCSSADDGMSFGFRESWYANDNVHLIDEIRRRRLTKKYNKEKEFNKLYFRRH